MAKNKYDYNTFKELYDSEIHYAYEPQYSIYKEITTYGNLATEIECVTIHKLSLFQNGIGMYKSNTFTFDPRLWPKIVAHVEMLQETKAEKVLFKPENKKSPEPEE